MDAHKHIPAIANITKYKSEMGLLVDLIFECVNSELSVFRRQLRRGNTLDRRFRSQPIGDQVGDRNQLNVMEHGKLAKFGPSGHRSIVAHDLADNPSGTKTCQSGQVHSSFRLPGTYQYSSVP